MPRSKSSPSLQLITEKEFAELLKRSPETLRVWRRQKVFIEGVHYQRVQGRICYFEVMAHSWIRHRNDPHQHQQDIDRFVEMNQF